MAPPASDPPSEDHKAPSPNPSQDLARVLADTIQSMGWLNTICLLFSLVVSRFLNGLVDIIRSMGWLNRIGLLLLLMVFLAASRFLGGIADTIKSSIWWKIIGLLLLTVSLATSRILNGLADIFFEEAGKTVAWARST